MAMESVPSVKVAGAAPGNGLDTLFRALSNPHRLHFLDDIAAEPRSASELAHASGLSIQEALRHLKQLTDVGAIQRRPDRTYILAPTGGVLRQALAPVHGLVADAAFTREHDLRFVPPHLCLGPLLTSPRVEGSETEIVAQLIDFMLEGSSAVYRAGSQTFLGIASGKLDDSGLARSVRRWHAVFSESVVASDAFLGWGDLVRRVAADPDALDLRVSVAHDMPFDLTINDGGMALLLQRADGRLDLTNLVLSRADEARAWANALFRSTQERSSVVFDTARGDRLRDWRSAVHARIAAARENGQPRRF